ncbi:MMPL family transporter [Antrihabitans sp. YC2-6]|uniref:MMPL family transporter n=1 Tax=Antrihabitans sp. YC2-6 TaxID=2799498 RepID=UPI001F1B79A2|nr:MMPL family transporter [Antrihabitans sp. YC2-6]
MIRTAVTSAEVVSTVSLDRMAQPAFRFPRVTLSIAFVFLILAAIYGLPAATSLPAGGYDDPASESAQAREVLDREFDSGAMPIVFSVTTADGVDSDAARTRGQAIVDALRTYDYAAGITSYWTAQEAASALRSEDGRTGLVAAEIRGDDSDAPARAHELEQRLAGSSDGVDVAAGGVALAYFEANTQSREDLLLAEAVAIPLTLLVLVWVFGSAVAAVLPLVVALFATAATMAALRALSTVTDVSVFALNLATALCLALAIDYTLFVVNRYREELGSGLPPDAALRRTMQTAGRTVVYSATTVALSIAAMAVFPMYFLRSLAYAGLAGVLFCTIGSLVVAPAMIVLLGNRLDRWDLRKPILRALGRRPGEHRSIESGFWYRNTIAVMRRALPIALAVVALLLFLGSPFLGVAFGYPDDRVLPTSASARAVGDVVRSDFSQNLEGAVTIVLPDRSGVGAEALDAYYARLSTVGGVTAVATPDGTYAGGRLVAPPPEAGADRAGVSEFVTASTTVDPFSTAAKNQLDELRAVEAPAPVLFDGLAQRNIDNVDAIVSRVPLVLSLIALTTFVLVFLLTGSVVLPIKALVANLLSMTAAFGAVVWIFQDGHLGALGITPTGYLTANIPPLMFCVVFGLSMDYEIFVLSRIREEWVKSGRTAADNERAVALGLARSARIVTAAASIMAIVFAAIMVSEVSFMRMLGAGLTITVLLDAFLVRTILVPAFMRLAGRANWWAPEPLARWHEKRGWHEGGDVERDDLDGNGAPQPDSNVEREPPAVRA